ncbi:MAG: enoyl-CoA hydratase-related protein, partial [Bradyrhizobium sp.]
LQWGLINRVVPEDKLMEEARSLAKQAVALSPTALKFLKHAFNADSAHIFGQAKMAADGLASFVNSDEAVEGRTAFLEKRQSDFSRFR